MDRRSSRMVTLEEGGLHERTIISKQRAARDKGTETRASRERGLEIKKLLKNEIRILTRGLITPPETIGVCDM